MNHMSERTYLSLKLTPLLHIATIAIYKTPPIHQCLSYLTKPLELIMADVTIVLLRNQQGVVQQRQLCSSRWHNVIVTDRGLACATLVLITGCWK